MKQRAASFVGPLGFVVVFMVAAFVGVAVVAGQGPAKAGLDPYDGMSDKEIEATIEGLRERNRDWVEEYNKSGNVFELPIVELSVYSVGAQSIEEARAEAAVVIAGKVLTTEYHSQTGTLTHSFATVAVTTDVKGNVPATILVEQIGGPSWSPSGGELQQLEGDPLLLPGQEVVLLLRQSSDGSRLYTVYGAGVYVVVNGLITADHGNPLSDTVNGLTTEAALKLFE